MTRIRLLSLVAAILFVLAGTSAAHAGQYTLSYDFAGDFSGWGGYVEPGYMLCGRSSPAGCPDISTNRIFARAGGSQAIWSQGRWEWTAPPGTLIVGGALTYRTRMRHSQFFARVKVRASGDWDAAPAIVAEQQTTALADHVVALPGGYRQVGVSLYAHPAAAGLVTDPWDDYITLVRLDVTVQDSLPRAWPGSMAEACSTAPGMRATSAARLRSRTPSPASVPCGSRATPPRLAGTLRRRAPSTSRAALRLSRACASRPRRSATARTPDCSGAWTPAAARLRCSRSWCASIARRRW